MPELQYLPHIPRTLNRDTIERALDDYRAILAKGPVQVIAETTPYAFLRALKRDKLKSGPYPGVSMFEAANRIMSDLVILYGVNQLLQKTFNGISFNEFTVQLGNEDHGLHDIVAAAGDYTLHGEAFNVAESFFYLKKRSSLDKLSKTNRPEKHFQVLLYNADATTSEFKQEGNLYYEPVHIDL